jgi:hypothetical protein
MFADFVFGGNFVNVAKRLRHQPPGRRAGCDRIISIFDLITIR